MGLAEYREAKNKLAEAKDAVSRAAIKAFRVGAAELFEKHPQLESFGWAQYTPYYNDGDECSFEANTESLTINENGEGDQDSGRDWEDGEWVQKREPSLSYILKNHVANFLCIFDDEDFKSMFGDHASVTVFREGMIEVQYYHHD